jgi:hypothetical protein
MSARVRDPTLCGKQPLSFELISQNQYHFSTMEQYFFSHSKSAAVKNHPAEQDIKPSRGKPAGTCSQP